MRQTHFERGEEEVRIDGLPEVTTCTKRADDVRGCKKYYYTCQSMATHPVSISAGKFTTAVVLGGYKRALRGWGPCWVPIDLTGVVEVSVSDEYAVALLRDGSVMSWADTNTTHFEKIHYVSEGLKILEVPGGLDNVVQVAAGQDGRVVALRENGTVTAWQADFVGPPGPDPELPEGLVTVAKVAAGWKHRLALLEDGSVVAWGRNLEGQCNVPAGLMGVVGMSAGVFHSLALLEDGSVVAWGDDEEGQCDVPEGLTGVVAVAAGMEHSLALLEDGSVVAWGSDGEGQCDVPAGLTDVVAVAAGWYHSVALQSDGTVVSWGHSEATDLPEDLHLPQLRCCPFLPVRRRPTLAELARARVR